MKAPKSIHILLIGMVFFVACNSNTPSRPTFVVKPVEEIPVLDELKSSETTLTEKEIDAYYKQLAASSRNIFSNAIIHNDQSMCDKLESIDAKFACTQNAIMTKAIASNDISMCDELASAESQQDCKNLYTTTHATKKSFL